MFTVFPSLSEQLSLVCRFFLKLMGPRQSPGGGGGEPRGERSPFRPWQDKPPWIYSTEYTEVSLWPKVI